MSSLGVSYGEDSLIFEAATGQASIEAFDGPASFQCYNIGSVNGSGATSVGTQYNLTLDANQVLSNYMVETFTVNCVLNMTVGAAAITVGNVIPFVEGFFGPRSFCIDRVTQNTTISANGVSFVTNLVDVVTPLASFMASEDSTGYMSTDLLPKYSDPLATGNQAYPFVIQGGAINNPLHGAYGATSKNLGRTGVIQNLSVSTNLPAAAGAAFPVTVSFTMSVPFINSLTTTDKRRERGLFGLRNSITVQRNLNAGAGTLLVQAAITNAITTGNVTSVSFSVSNPMLSYSLMTITPYVKVPKTFYFAYDYLNQVQASTLYDLGVVGASSSLSINGIQLGRVPKYIYVYCANLPTAAATSAGNAGGVARTITQLLAQPESPATQITNLNVSCSASSAAMFSNMSAIQLYEEFGYKQGFVKSYPETGAVSAFIGTGTVGTTGNFNSVGLYGSVLKIPGSYLQFDWSKFTVGSPITCNMNITAQVTQLKAATVGAVSQLFAVIVDQNVLEIDTDTYATRIISEFVDRATLDSLHAITRAEEAKSPGERDLTIMGGKVLRKKRM